MGNPDSSIGKPDRGKWQQRPEQGKPGEGNLDKGKQQWGTQTEKFSRGYTRQRILANGEPGQGETLRGQSLEIRGVKVMYCIAVTARNQCS